MNIIINKRKTFGIIISILIITIFLLITFLQKEPTHSNVTKVDMHGDTTESYQDIDSLKENADLIAIVESKKSNSFLYSEVPFTVNDIKVQKLFKGQLDNNKELKLLETGGLIDDVDYSFEGNYSMKQGERAIVFLKKYEGPIIDNGYVLLGAFQGKFKLKTEENTLVPPKEVSEKLKKVNKISDLNL